MQADPPGPGREPGEDFADGFQLDDGVAMDAGELRGREERLEFGDRPVREQFFGGRMEKDEAVLGLGVENLAAIQQDNPLAAAGGQLDRRRLAEGGLELPEKIGRGEAGGEPVEGAVEGRGLDGFEEIVDGVGFKGADGVGVKGRTEDDGRGGGELGEKVEAIEAGHFDVEKENAGTGGGNLFEGVDAMDGFFDAGDGGMAGEEAAESPAGGLFVVDDERVH